MGTEAVKVRLKSLLSQQVHRQVSVQKEWKRRLEMAVSHGNEA